MTYVQFYDKYRDKLDLFITEMEIEGGKLGLDPSEAAFLVINYERDVFEELDKEDK